MISFYVFNMMLRPLVVLAVSLTKAVFRIIFM